MARVRIVLDETAVGKDPMTTLNGDRRGRRRERGTALAEFALVAPLLLILLFGIIEFSIAFNRAQAVEAAAREGARLASLSTTSNGEIVARVDDALAGITMDGPVNVSVSASCFGRQGQQVTVTVTTDHDVNIPLWGDRTIELQSEAVFRCEA